MSATIQRKKIKSYLETNVLKRELKNSIELIELAETYDDIYLYLRAIEKIINIFDEKLLPVQFILVELKDNDKRFT